MGDGEEDNTGPTVADIAVLDEDDDDLSLQSIRSASGFRSSSVQKNCAWPPKPEAAWMKINR